MGGNREAEVALAVSAGAVRDPTTTSYPSFGAADCHGDGVHHKKDQMPGLAKPNGLKLVEVQYQNQND